jgi:hypothetical protein
VSLIPCCVCHGHIPNKPVSIYWAWNRADGSRAAWLQKVCVACFAAGLAQLAQKIAPDALVCPQCGIGTVDDMDPVYASLYIPGYEKITVEAPLCGPCAVPIRTAAQVGATALPQRQGVLGGQGQAPQLMPADQVWRDLGNLPWRN